MHCSSQINKPTPSFLQAGCPSRRPTNSVKALKVKYSVLHYMSWLLIQIQVPFDRYFKVEPLQRYHRVLTMETFMAELAPAIWPPGNRTGNGSVAVC